MHVFLSVQLQYGSASHSLTSKYKHNTLKNQYIYNHNHKSSLNRYGRGQTNVAGQHLYAHFFGEGHSGLCDLSVQVINCTDVNNPTERESFWIEKLNCYVPNGLNLKEEV